MISSKRNREPCYDLNFIWEHPWKTMQHTMKHTRSFDILITCLDIQSFWIFDLCVTAVHSSNSTLKSYQHSSAYIWNYSSITSRFSMTSEYAITEMILPQSIFFQNAWHPWSVNNKISTAIVIKPSILSAPADDTRNLSFRCKSCSKEKIKNKKKASTPSNFPQILSPSPYRKVSCSLYFLLP